MKYRASILLEVLIATAVFAFAGVVVLSVVDGSVTDGARAARRSLAMDMARSALARMESGISSSESEVQSLQPANSLRVEQREEASDFPGLRLVVIEVFDDAASANGDAPRIAVLRQLLKGDAGAGADRPEISR